MAPAALTTVSKRSARGTSVGLPRLLSLLGLLALALSLQGCSLSGNSSGGEKGVEKLEKQVADAEAKVAELQKKIEEEKEDDKKAELQGELTKAQEHAKTLAEKLEKTKAESVEASTEDESDTKEAESDKMDGAAKGEDKNPVASALMQHLGEEDDAQHDEGVKQEEHPAHGGNVESALLEQHARRAAGASKRERTTAMAASVEATADHETKGGVKDVLKSDIGSENHLHADIRLHEPSKGCKGEDCEIPEED